MLRVPVSVVLGPIKLTYFAVKLAEKPFFAKMANGDQVAVS